MDFVGGHRSTLRRPWRVLAWACRPGPLALLPGLTLAADSAPVAFGPTAIGLVVTLAVAVVAGGVGAMLTVRSGRATARLAEELRLARVGNELLEQMLDVWQWRSDAEHRVQSLRPPHGAEHGEWADAAPSAPAWDLFCSADASALQARMRSGAALDDVPVQRKGQGRALLRGRTITDAAGHFAGYVGTVREITEVPLAAKEAASPSAGNPLPPSETDAASSASPSSLAAQSDHESFSFTVSHDLRAPIRVVEGFTKIVKEDYGRLLDRVGNDHLDRVLGAAARMNNMIDALLALSKLSSQPLARQPVNLSQLAGYVADDLRRQWPEREVSVQIDPGMQVQGDPTLLRVVIENMLGNAWKYTGKATRPGISFVRHPDARDTFTVSDNGAGFDMRFADRLFGVFQRLHSANDFPGTGIGLASVRRIVRRHGGEIWGEAEVNRGARFHFSLPQGGEA